MNRTRQLSALGQSLWLDNISRALLDDGTLARYIEERSITGLTSNPTIFDKAIGQTAAYDRSIRDKTRVGHSGEALFIELALEDLRRAADLFRPVFDATGGVDGWVSMEISPLLADDTAGSIAAAAKIHAQADRPNLFVKIPGTAAGVPAIEESIFAGVPINVTLLFSVAQYVAAAEAYLRGIERRLAAGLDPQVASVASLFVSVGCGSEGQGGARAEKPPRHRDRRSDLPRVPRAARLAALARVARRRRSPAAAALGQHWHQGPRRAGHAVYRGAGGARHDQHHPRQDARGVRGSRRASRLDGDRRR
jgi:hypothetical protein